jgi:hypothetical protein
MQVSALLWPLSRLLAVSDMLLLEYKLSRGQSACAYFLWCRLWLRSFSDVYSTEEDSHYPTGPVKVA